MLPTDAVLQKNKNNNNKTASGATKVDATSRWADIEKMDIKN